MRQAISDSGRGIDALDELSRRGDGERLPHSAIPLSVVVSPPVAALCEAVGGALARLSVDLVVVDSPLRGDPRLVADLVVVDALRLGPAIGNTVHEARMRWPTAMMVCLGVATEPLASELLALGADIALREDVSSQYARDVITAAGRRLTLANAQLRITYGDLVFDRDARRVWCAGEPVALTERELQLFQHLFLYAGHVVSPSMLVARAWRVDPTIASNGLAVYIGYLRRKLRRSRLVELATVRGEGYSLRLRAGAAG